MNTVTADVRPAKIAHAFHAQALPAAPWTVDRRARLLLASIAANPPELVEHQARYGRSSDCWVAYAGYRAEALEAVRMEHGQRALDAYHTDPEASEAAFNAWCYAPTATQAIDAVMGSC